MAFFPGSFQEENGAAHISRPIEAFVRKHNLPFLRVRVGNRGQKLRAARMMRLVLDSLPLRFAPLPKGVLTLTSVPWYVHRVSVPVRFYGLRGVFRVGRAGVAQLVEHLICNQRVGGSNPFASSIYESGKRGLKRQ